MNLFCLGINHRNAPLEVREKFWFSGEEIPAALASLREHGIEEAALVSTCNRMELYYLAEEQTPSQEEIKKIIASFKNPNDAAATDYLYSLTSLNAAKHLFKLASGIDSMVLGDVQILNQVKAAFKIAQESQSVGLILNRLFESALRVGKRVRSETGVGDGAVSVGYAAAELASRIFFDISERTALLIGAGETAELTAKHLCGQHLGKLCVTNRTRERAEQLSAELNGNVADFASWKDHLKDVDIVISSVGVQEYILTSADIRQATRARGNKPLFILDLGVPRTVDPSAGAIDNVFLHDIDSLNRIVDKNLSRRRAEIPKALEIVRDELAEFYRWHNGLQVTSTIQKLREQFEEIRQAEVERSMGRFGSEMQENVAILTKRIVNKILHSPMVYLRTGAARDNKDSMLRDLDVLRSLFGLESKLRE